MYEEAALNATHIAAFARLTLEPRSEPRRAQANA